MSLHPQALILSEFFSALHPQRGWPYDRNVTADEFIEILKREEGISPIWMALGQNISEVLVDLDAEKAKKKGFLNRPTILFIALRFLSENPEALFEEIIDNVSRYAAQPLRSHFLQLFDWLAERYEKSFWIERSGMSTNTFRQIRRTFPDARFVHIHRDGAETALSIKEHVSAALIVNYHFYSPSDEELRKSMDLSIPSSENPMMQRLENSMPVEKFGEYWSYSLALAYRELPYLNPGQLHEVRFEDLMENPRQVLTAIAEFFELPHDADWVEQAVSKVRNVPTRVESLSAAERERLEQACHLGSLLVNRDEGQSAADTTTATLAQWLKDL